MDKELPQITFDFGAEGENREFLSGQPQQPPRKEEPRGRGRRSLKDVMNDDAPEVPADEVLFAKQYWPIGEVAAMFHVNISLIRYWENEFDILEPRKNRKGDRLFKPTDVKNLQLIYDLLRRRRFTIEGAKDFIRRNRQAKETFEMIESLRKLRGFLLELKANL